MTELHNDHAQQANNEGAYIPMEEVDAALRRIEATADWWGSLAPWVPSKAIEDIKDEIAQERERLGLPKEVNV